MAGDIPNLSSTYETVSAASTALSGKADKVSITGATNTKITYNSQGIVTAGAQAQFSDLGGSITESQVTNLTSDLASKAPLASPALAGNPTAPTPATADNSTSIATTAFVKAQGYVTSSSAPVTSVFGRSGAVAALSGDYSFDKIAAGSNVNTLTIGTGGSLAPAGTGTITANALVAATYNSVLNFNNAGNSFAGSGAGLTNLNASNLSTGTIPGGRIGAPGMILASATYTAAANNDGGNTISATASCSGHGVMLAGGGQVSNNDTATGAPLETLMLASYPLTSSQWTVTGVTNGLKTKNSSAMTVNAWAICSGS